MKHIDRREFLKTLGLAGAAATGISTLAGCGSNQAEEMTYDPNGTVTGEIPTDKMEYRSYPSLGDDKVSLLGYGCMRWPMIPNPDGEGEIVDQEQVNKLVDYAIAHGVNYFDTAPVYLQGKSEKATGIALSRYPRESYYIATKCSNPSFARPGVPPEEVFQRSKEMYERSFSELGVDYIDYYLLHNLGGGGDDCMNVLKQRFFDCGMLDYLVEEKKKGKIRRLGWSFHGNVKVFDYLLQLHDEGKYHWDFVQIQMNYVDWENAAEGRNVQAKYLYAELEKRNIPAVIMEPLLGGRLSKLPNHVVGILKQQEPEKSVASWAFRFLGNFPDILCVLSGMTYMEHLQDNLRSFAPYKKLTDDEMKFLFDTAKIINDYPTIPCNDCKYCMPCPYGLDIPAILVHYNKMVNEGSVPESVKDPRYAELRKKYLVTYDRAVEKVRQANHCTNCNECIEHCPQQIRIPQQLQRIDKFVEDLKQNTLGVETAEKA